MEPVCIRYWRMIQGGAAVEVRIGASEEEVETFTVEALELRNALRANEWRKGLQASPCIRRGALEKPVEGGAHGA